MREYEIVTVLNPALGQEDVAALWERVKKNITDRGGELFHEEHWGMRRLAYPIRRPGHKFIEGNYYLARFKGDQTKITELETQLRLTEEVLRFLVVRWDPIMQPPAPSQRQEVPKPRPEAQAAPMPQAQPQAQTETAPA